MAINATVDGVTYSGIDTINTGGKVIGLSVDAGANYGPGMVERNISAISDSEITYVGGYAFYSFKTIKSVNLPNANTIQPYAFANCGITDAHFPSVSYIQQNAFENCLSLTTASFPDLTSTETAVFIGCSSMLQIYAPNLNYISTSCFQNCSRLQSVSFPLAGKIGSSAFANCYSISEVEFLGISSIAGSLFMQCMSLEKATFGNISQVGYGAFQSCYHLTELRITGSSVANLLASWTLGSTPIAGYTTSTGGVYGSIYVPASLLTAYQSATNWAYFSERFVGV